MRESYLTKFFKIKQFETCGMSCKCPHYIQECHGHGDYMFVCQLKPWSRRDKDRECAGFIECDVMCKNGLSVYQMCFVKSMDKILTHMHYVWNQLYGRNMALVSALFGNEQLREYIGKIGGHSRKNVKFIFSKDITWDDKENLLAKYGLKFTDDEYKEYFKIKGNSNELVKVDDSELMDVNENKES